MTALDAVLAAAAHCEGRAQRRSTLRHRHLVDRPLVVVPWHLGAEPFTFAALAYGEEQDHFQLAVPGEPRNRDLLFAATLEVAEWFIERFEEPWSRRTVVEDYNRRRELAPEAPQLWVPNQGAVTVLAKLGRRLAYLPTEPRDEGPPPADLRLVRLGRHLQFLAAHAVVPGQQLIVSATGLAGANWMTEQTPTERANLAALDAWIDPPADVHGFDAASAAEGTPVGPLPLPEVEKRVDRLMGTFNDARRSGPDSEQRKRLSELGDLYEMLSQPAWELTWRVIERERSWREDERFLPRRWFADVDAYSRHLEWMNGPNGGRRRTRQTVVQAIRSRRKAEEAKGLVEAEEAITDPIRMIPYLLDHKAVEGRLVRYDAGHREIKEGNKRPSTVPIVHIRTDRPCLMPLGKKLWWTEAPDKVLAVVHELRRDVAGPGSIVALKIAQNLKEAGAMATTSGTVCFSQLTTKIHWAGSASETIPWTHRTVEHPAAAHDIEEPA